jgi:hypothetical protein
MTTIIAFVLQAKLKASLPPSHNPHNFHSSSLVNMKRNFFGTERKTEENYAGIFIFPRIHIFSFQKSGKNPVQ